ncbi:MAG: hypothetical protein QOK07_1569 [Gemmatimonadaceae bacterium]|nr:hypothetical protein [Gemmatimonadaceae bacterium]
MFSSARRLLSVSTSGAAMLALVLFVSPLSAQKTTITLTNATITFPAPTATDYINGYVDAATGVFFNLDATAGASRTATVLIRATSASLGGGKVLSDLKWRRSDLANWSAITSTDAQVEQRVMVKNGANGPWSNTIFFRMLLDWTKDAPATYTANYVITLSQTP